MHIGSRHISSLSRGGEGEEGGGRRRGVGRRREDGGGGRTEDGGGRTDVEDTWEIEEGRGERGEVARKARRRKTERRTGR